eukprot:534199-Prymnesium_polylepis.1
MAARPPKARWSLTPRPILCADSPLAATYTVPGRRRGGIRNRDSQNRSARSRTTVSNGRRKLASRALMMVSQCCRSQSDCKKLRWQSARPAPEQTSHPRVALRRSSVKQRRCVSIATRGRSCRTTSHESSEGLTPKKEMAGVPSISSRPSRMLPPTSVNERCWPVRQTA